MPLFRQKDKLQFLEIAEKLETWGTLNDNFFRQRIVIARKKKFGAKERIINLYPCIKSPLISNNN